MKRWRLIIAMVFVVGLVTQVVCALILARAALNPGDLGGLITKLLSIYATPGGTILGGMLIASKRQQKGNALQKPEAWEVYTSLGVALVWNGLLMVRYILLTAGTFPDDTTKDLAVWQDAVSTGGGWLTTAMLAYMYGGHDK